MNYVDKQYQAHEVVCREGDISSNDLLFVLSGNLLVVTKQGTEIKVLNRIGAKEFIGELSFFDTKPRTASIISTEPTTIRVFPRNELYQKLPSWFTQIGTGITRKIRTMDRILHESKIKKSSLKEHKPLTIDEQRKILQVLS